MALSADGNTAIVGGFHDDPAQVGAAWIFTRSGGVWTQQGPKLVGTGALGASHQGRSVSLSADGDTAVVGGEGDDDGVGAAWVFTRTGGAWTQLGEKLVGSGAVGTSQQGLSVALSGDGRTAVIGGGFDADSTGAAWLFTRNGGLFTQQGSKLVGTDAVGPGRQGVSVALSGDGRTALVGGSEDRWGVGAAWVFAALEPLRLYTLTPCRVLDTRNPAGPLGGPALAPGSSRTFPMLGSACGVPSSARSLSLNVTVTQPEANGSLQAHAADQAVPPTIVLGFRAGQTRANNAIVMLPADGSGGVSVIDGSAGSVHLLVDVNGYFQ